MIIFIINTGFSLIHALQIRLPFFPRTCGVFYYPSRQVLWMVCSALARHWQGISQVKYKCNIVKYAYYLSICLFIYLFNFIYLLSWHLKLWMLMKHHKSAEYIEVKELAFTFISLFFFFNFLYNMSQLKLWWLKDKNFPDFTFSPKLNAGLGYDSYSSYFSSHWLKFNTKF